MGVVCCEGPPPKLAHQDDDKQQQQQTFLPQPHLQLKSPADTDDALLSSTVVNNTTDKKNKKKRKKTGVVRNRVVRINKNVTYIPLLTSASFFSTTATSTATTTATTGTTTSTPCTKASLWWTKEERKEILLSNQRVSRNFKRYHPIEVQRANLVFHEIVNDCNQNNNNYKQDDNNYPSSASSSDENEDADNHFKDDVYNFFQRERLKQRRIAATATATGAAAIAISTTNPITTKKRKRHNTVDKDDNEPRSSSSSILSEGITTTAAIAVAERIRSTDRIELESGIEINLPTHVRGLEWAVIPDAKRYRKTHSRTILRLQEHFRRRNNNTNYKNKNKKNNSIDYDDSSSFDDDDANEKCSTSLTLYEQQELLGHTSTISSRRSVKLAQVLADLDARSLDTITTTTASVTTRNDDKGNETPSLTGTTDSDDSSDINLFEPLQIKKAGIVNGSDILV
ncbi:hypothetical protein FRACYDRAFT_263308 [Fragilariopsis cylindrus CCMP1102]|uniref:Uncharacterized protein n=1 Tax=Fragilariopsis cylindrus CCMP1102 TaxID=635003 RepID=A0A1E7F118_9STRA|nr:hypothetical protein FRACYDRAFT_263308 [Fragilariopsis cylindrus CCMP1102]|eukprot:OEU11755.1 hypothetical protein FRACYDRAFT_263308 [Fragilariopsis cylindrus CCMP1102]